MGIAWIVVARRATITPGGISYEDAVDAWLEQLAEHRDRLLSWYRPLAPAAVAGQLDDGFDEAVGFVRQWRHRYFSGDPVVSRSMAAAGDAGGSSRGHATARVWSFAPRLWKGPLRVLLEARVEPDTEVPAGLSRIEVDHGGAHPLLTSPAHEILGRQTQLLPGDVIEFPVFRVWEAAGLQRFAGARFDPMGNFLCGTAVTMAGATPEPAPLHDNMVAMRFQLLINAAQGAYHSLDHVFVAGSDAERKANHADCGHSHHVRARGLIYAGTQGSPNRLDDRYLIRDGNWCTGRYTPTHPTLAQMPPSLPITWGWTCVTCTLSLFHFMLDDAGAGWHGGGSVGGQARRLDRPTPISSTSQYLHFHPHFTSPSLNGLDHDQRMGLLRTYCEQAGVDADAALRAAAPFRGNEHRQQQLQQWALCRALRDHWAANALGTAAPAPAAPPAEEEPDDEQPIVRTPCEEGGDECEPDDVPDTADWDEALVSGEDVALGEAGSRALLGELSTVSLERHEYAFVKVYAHDRLLDEDPGPHPPLAGRLAAYNPLTGEPYESHAEGKIHVFEAAGTIRRSSLRGDDAVDTLGIRPHRWMPVEQLYLRREEGALPFHLGEGRQTGAHQHSTRSQRLVAVTRLPYEQLRARFAQPRPGGYLPLTFESRREDGDDLRRDHWYPERSVPFATMEEAKLQSFYPSVATATATLERHRTYVRSLLRRSRPYSLTRLGITVADRLMSENMLQRRTRQVERNVDARERQLPNELSRSEGRITRLESQTQDTRAAIAGYDAELAELSAQGRRPGRAGIRRNWQQRRLDRQEQQLAE
ncbi:MAG: hypothetical protein K0V04_39420, partial [Deltaproteobacteria bacterium]|nr:hypothetical protein [Deltaproteobacteria bacterium]